MKEHPTEILIREARELLQPSLVRLHHVPDWFRRALLRTYGCSGGDTSGWGVLEHARRLNGWEWLDHYGSTTRQEQTCFVSEPYHVSLADHQQVAELAERIGCRVYLSALSWWFPGATLRIVFEQRREAP